MVVQENAHLWYGQISPRFNLDSNNIYILGLGGEVSRAILFKRLGLVVVDQGIFQCSTTTTRVAGGASGVLLSRLLRYASILSTQIYVGREQAIFEILS